MKISRLFLSSVLALTLATTAVVAHAAPGTVDGGSSADSSAPAAPATVSGGSSAPASAPATVSGDSSAPASAPSTVPGDSSAPASTPASTPAPAGSNEPLGGGPAGGSHSSGGGYGYATPSVAITDVVISKVSNTQLKVTWTTTPAAQAELVWGTVSIKSPFADQPYFGYTNGTGFDSAAGSHVAFMTITSGTTYYVRPIAKVNGNVLFGTEIALTPVAGSATTVSTAPSARPAVGTETGGTVKVDFSLPGTEDTGGVISKAPDTTGTAAVAGSSFGSKIVGFFKNLWDSVTAPICR